MLTFPRTLPIVAVVQHPPPWDINAAVRAPTPSLTIGRTKGRLNTKLHAVTDAKGRPLRFFMTAGQVSDYTGAAALLGSLPAAEWLIADRG